MDKRIAQFILDPAGRLRLIPLSCCVVLAAAIFATSAGAFDRARSRLVGFTRTAGASRLRRRSGGSTGAIPVFAPCTA
jgi:hypothetical protein